MARIEAYVAAPQAVADGTLIDLRMGRDRSLITQDGHARFQEAVYRGNVFTQATVVAGVTIAAANVFSASPIQPLVGIYNPVTSGRNAVIWIATHTWNSGTPGTGGLVWAVITPTTTITGTPSNTAINNFTFQTASAGSAMKSFANAAMTGSGAGSLLAYAGGPPAFALAAGAAASYFDFVDGRIIVPPGGSLGLCAGASGTSPIVNASVTWEEIPL